MRVVDFSTGQGLERGLRAAEVVVDVTDAPSREQGVSTEFFTTATGNLLRAAAATAGTRPGGVHVPPPLLRPVATDDVATTLAHVAVGLPHFGVLEAAGPEELSLRDATAELLAARGRTKPVIADAAVPFFGAVLEERALLPGPDAHLGHPTFAQWLKSH
jgi:uncharacterized protein YbjT (DUF2867 family)